MGKIAFLFAGQGAQAPGMGQSLYEKSPAAKAVFDTMEAVRPGTLDDCFASTAERLKQTSVTQPCVYTVDLACAAALCEAGITPDGAAGFSLGEVAALGFAGAYGAQEAARLVVRRGQLMEEAAQKHPGAMTAVMRLDNASVEALCHNFDNIWPVNYNCPGQLVVAGSEESMPAFAAAVKAAGGMARPLPVGGAFHTPWMRDAADAFVQALSAAEAHPLTIPVYANLTARPYGSGYAGTLAEQMYSPVRWQQTIENMQADGFDTFVELGPGKALSGFVKRIAPEAALCNVSDADTLAEALQMLNP